MKKEFQLSDRREFLADSLRSAALLAALATGRSQAADKAGSPNPFAYDVSRLAKTDPKLIAYEEVTRWKCPHPGALLFHRTSKSSSAPAITSPR